MPGHKETLNFYRISSLILVIASNVLSNTIKSVCKRLNTTFEDLLRLNKHRFFHLWRTEQCCLCASRPQQTQTCMVTSQWDLLYQKEDTRCQLGSYDVCSCSYGARSGVDIDELDPNLATTVLINLHSMNQNEYTLVTKLRELRNKFLGFRTTMSLDDETFSEFWEEIRSPIEKLAKLNDSGGYENVLSDIESLSEQEFDDDKVSYILEKLDCEIEIVDETKPVNDTTVYNRIDQGEYLVNDTTAYNRIDQEEYPVNDTTAYNRIDQEEGPVNDTTAYNRIYQEEDHGYLYAPDMNNQMTDVGFWESLNSERQSFKERSKSYKPRYHYVPYNFSRMHQVQEIQRKPRYNDTSRENEIIQDERQHGEFIHEAKERCHELYEKCRNFKREIQHARSLLHGTDTASTERTKQTYSTSYVSLLESPGYAGYHISRSTQTDTGVSWQHIHSNRTRTVMSEVPTVDALETYRYKTGSPSGEQSSYGNMRDRCQRISERCHVMKTDIQEVQTRLNNFSRKLTSVDEMRLRKTTTPELQIMRDKNRISAKMKSKYGIVEGEAYGDYNIGTNTWERNQNHIHPDLSYRAISRNAQPEFWDTGRGKEYRLRVNPLSRRHQSPLRSSTGGELKSQLRATAEERHHGYFLSHCKERWKSLNRKCFMMKQKIKTARKLFQQSSKQGGGDVLEAEDDNTDPYDSSFSLFSVKEPDLLFKDLDNTELDDSYLGSLKSQEKTRSFTRHERNVQKDRKPEVVRNLFHSSDSAPKVSKSEDMIGINESFAESEYSSLSTYLALKRAEVSLREIKGPEYIPDDDEKDIVAEEKDHGTILEEFKYQSNNLSVKCDEFRRQIERVRRQFDIGPREPEYTAVITESSSEKQAHSSENVESESDSDSITEGRQDRFWESYDIHGRHYNANARSKFVRSTDSGFVSLASPRHEFDTPAPKSDSISPMAVIQDSTCYSETKIEKVPRDVENDLMMSNFIENQEESTTLATDHFEPQTQSEFQQAEDDPVMDVHMTEPCGSHSSLPDTWEDEDTKSVAIVAEKSYGQVLTNLKRDFQSINQRNIEIQREIREARRLINATNYHPIYSTMTALS